MQTFLFISLGAIVGANLRYLIGQYSARLIPSSLPYGTLFVNVTGSFILGLFLVWTTERAIAGFNGRNRVHTSGLVEAGGNLPVLIIFVDFEEHVSRVLPQLREMAPQRLIVRENVVIEQGNLD